MTDIIPSYKLPLLCTIISVFLLIGLHDSIAANIILVAFSIPLLLNPSYILPLVWVSSWYSKMVVIPGMGAFYYYIILMLLSFIIFGNSSYKRDFRGISLWILFSVLIFVSSLLGVSKDCEPTIKLFVSVLFSWLAIRYVDYDSEYLKGVFVYISILSSIYFFFRSFINKIPYFADEVEFLRYTYIPEMNPNSLAPIVVIISLIILGFVIRANVKWPLLLIVSNILALFILGSRTSFAVLVILLLVYFFKSSEISSRYKWFAVLIIISSLLMMYTLSGDTITQSRIITNSIISDGGNGRFTTWNKLMLETYPRFWLIGFGVGRINYSLLGYEYDADNMYVDLLCQTGIIGATILILLLFSIIRYLRKLPQIEDYVILIISSFLLLGLGESVFDSPLFWMTIVIVFAMTNFDDINYELLNDNQSAI